MDDRNRTTETTTVRTHGTVLEVVYTNEEHTVERILKKYEEWLAEEKHQFIGLDIEYTRDRRCMAVLQLAMRQHVLVFHWCKSKKNCLELGKFFERKNITFASVDITNDSKVLSSAGFHIPPEYYVDIQLVYKIKGGDERDGMGDLAADLIDKSYANMKKEFPSNQHNFWEWMPLHKVNLDYAAIDRYVTYELYRTILTLKDRLRPTWQEMLCPRCKNALGELQ